jgi:hypothetical protein
MDVVGHIAAGLASGASCTVGTGKERRWWASSVTAKMWRYGANDGLGPLAPGRDRRFPCVPRRPVG